MIYIHECECGVTHVLRRKKDPYASGRYSIEFADIPGLFFGDNSHATIRCHCVRYVTWGGLKRLISDGWKEWK